jgi:hypothetical protein
MARFSGIKTTFFLRAFHFSLCYPAVFIALTLLPAFAFGQESENCFRDRMQIKEITMTTGYGEGNTDSGVYQHMLLSVGIGVDLATFLPPLEHSRGITSLVVVPEINPVLGPETGVEFGISLGIKHRIPLNKAWHVYFTGSVGPHYITVETEEQADGFIFFNSIGTGVSFFLTARSAINFEYRFRHASNASTREPNGGIDSHMGVVGYSLFF